MDLLNAIVALANFVIVPATAYGAQLALGALGVTLIYGVLRFSNLAQGEMMAFGAGITILIVKQNARQALEIADKGYLRVHGRNAHTGTGAELLGNPDVRRTFLGG